MKKIIVTGHGKFASGFQSAIEMLAGHQEDFYYVDFLAEDSDENLATKLNTILTEEGNHEWLVFCDIAGGTPFKVAATLAYEKDTVEVVAGANIGSLLEILFSKENFELGDLAAKVIDSSRSSALRFEKNGGNSGSDAAEEDGI